MKWPLVMVVAALMLIMVGLGLELAPSHFRDRLKNPRGLAAGLLGQMVLLPAAAALLTQLFSLPPVFACGVILIACSPGGASSNAFAMLVRGDVALSVLLTAVSSFASLLTVPLIMTMALGHFLGKDTSVVLPPGPTVLKLFLVSVLPILAGMTAKHLAPGWAARAAAALKKLSPVLLLLVVTVFFIRERHTLLNHIGQLGAVLTLLIVMTMSVGYLLGRLFSLPREQNRSIVVEVGLQNAAQAIFVAAVVLKTPGMAVPAVVYSVLMNAAVLGYLALIRGRDIHGKNNG